MSQETPPNEAALTRDLAPANLTAEGVPHRNGRTPAFVTLFMVEMWERFGYYGMAVLLVVFMKKHMGFADQRANLTWGAFAAMVYAVPTIGGWLGDKVLGARRMTLLGAIVLTVGYALLAIPGQPSWFFFFSLGLIAAGNGLFKANPNNLVSRIYEGDDAALDGAFTMYYMAINIGAFLSQMACPKIAEHFGWYYAFGLCSVGLVLGIILFLVMRKKLAHVGSKPDFQPLNLARLGGVLVGTVVIAGLIALVVQNLTIAKVIVYLAGVLLLALFAILIAKGSKSERSGLIAMLLLVAQAILFFVFYQQMSTSLTLFAVRNVDLNFYGYRVPPEQFQVLNPFWIAVCSPLLAILYSRLGKKGKDPSVAVKFAIGFVLLAVGFFLYGASGRFAQAGLVSSWWMVGGYFFQSVGELLISGLGLAMVSRYVGPNLRGLMMGAWLLATGIAQYLGSVVANFASVPDTVTDPLQTLGLYTHLFNVLGLVAVAGTVVAFAMLPLMKKLDQSSKQGAAA